MSLVIEMSAEDEVRLADKARGAGVDLPTFVERVLKVEASRPPIEEIFRPVHDAFGESGMTEEQLSDLLVAAKKQMRVDRRRRATE